MKRIIKELVGLSDLYNLSKIHDRDSMTNVSDRAKIVRNVEVCDAEFLLKLL